MSEHESSCIIEGLFSHCLGCYRWGLIFPLKGILYFACSEYTAQHPFFCMYTFCTCLFFCHFFKTNIFFKFSYSDLNAPKNKAIKNSRELQSSFKSVILNCKLVLKICHKFFGNFLTNPKKKNYLNFF